MEITKIKLPNITKFGRHEDLVIIPSGNVYAITNIRGDIETFIKLLDASQALERAADKKAYILIIGDMVGFKETDKHMVDYLIAIKQEIGDQLIHLMGKHELDALNYRKKYESILNGDHKILSTINQNEIKKIALMAKYSQENIDYLTQLPAIAYMNGIIALAGGPSKHMNSMEKVENIEKLVNSSPLSKKCGHSKEDIDIFLDKMNGTQIISGNTDITLLNLMQKFNDSITINMGVAQYGKQIIFTSNYGALYFKDKKKKYDIDKKHYLKININKKKLEIVPIELRKGKINTTVKYKKTK